jgi:hypothetical protein
VSATTPARSSRRCSGVIPGTPETNGDIPCTGVGGIACLLDSRNIAVVGYDETIYSDAGTFFGEGALVIEDNGADR